MRYARTNVVTFAGGMELAVARGMSGRSVTSTISTRDELDAAVPDFRVTVRVETSTFGANFAVGSTLSPAACAAHAVVRCNYFGLSGRNGNHCLFLAECI